MNKYTIGVDVGGTNVKMGLVNRTGKVIARSHLDTKRYVQHKDKLIDAISAGAKLTKADAGRALDATIESIHRKLKVVFGGKGC